MILHQNEVIAILGTEIPDLDVTAKFALLALAQRGLAPMQAAPEGWARALGLPVSETVPTLRQLAEAGCVTQVAVPGKGKGRPSLEYRCEIVDLKQLAEPLELTGASSRFEALVLHLVAGAGDSRLKGNVGENRPPSRLGAGKVLSISNRMTLSVLLTFADSSGVVRAKGTTALAALAGMTPTRFETQIGKLLDLGFIRSYVPGVSGAPLLGVVPGVYFLNLGHISYGPYAIPSIAYTCPADRQYLFYETRGNGDIERLRIDAQRSRSWKLGDTNDHPLSARFRSVPGASPETLCRLARIVDTGWRQGLTVHLQYILESQASQLMTDSRAGIPGIGLDELRVRFFQVLYPAKRREAGDGVDDRETIEAIELLCAFLAKRAAVMADYLTQQIDKFQDDSKSISLLKKSPDSFVILPWIPPTNTEFMTVLAVHLSPHVSEENSYFLYKTNDVKKDNRYLFEFDFEKIEHLPDKERAYEVGLFTRPRNKPMTVPKKNGKTKRKRSTNAIL